MQSIVLLNHESSRMQEATFLTGIKDYEGALFRGHSFCILMNPDEGHAKHLALDPYIKLGNGNSYDGSSAITRISLRNPRVIEHKDGKYRIIITMNLLRNLNKAMTFKCNYGKYHGNVLDCINAFLTDFAPSQGVKHIPIPFIDFTQFDFSSYKRRGDDKKLC